MGFTSRVREELAHVPVDADVERQAEAAALLRFGGLLSLRGGATHDGFGHLFESDIGAVVRRLHAHLRAVGGDRPEVEVHRPGGLRRTTTYRLRLEPGAPVLLRLGIVDAAGRPLGVQAGVATTPAATRAYLRGAVMAAGSISDPRAAPHAEVTAPGEVAARHLDALLAVLGITEARATAAGERWRVVLKSGRRIGELLAALGAHGAYLEWDQAVLRRELRGEANRVANADRANLSRAVEAARRHVAAIERLVDEVGWDGLPDDLRPVALARMANPEASLAELGDLLDPPVGKLVVHRRLRRLLDLAAGL
jgi:DNA-binding protein WhiA